MEHSYHGASQGRHVLQDRQLDRMHRDKEGALHGAQGGETTKALEILEHPATTTMPRRLPSTLASQEPDVLDALRKRWEQIGGA